MYVCSYVKNDFFSGSGMYLSIHVSKYFGYKLVIRVLEKRTITVAYYAREHFSLIY